LHGGFSVRAEEELGRAMGPAQRVRGGGRGAGRRRANEGEGFRPVARGTQGERHLVGVAYAEAQQHTQSISGEPRLVVGCWAGCHGLGPMNRFTCDLFKQF
jgi:hypothetical protein